MKAGAREVCTGVGGWGGMLVATNSLVCGPDFSGFTLPATKESLQPSCPSFTRELRVHSECLQHNLILQGGSAAKVKGFRSQNKNAIRTKLYASSLRA